MKITAKLLPALVLALGATAWGAESTVGAVVDDAALTAKVKTALVQNPSTKAHQIDVDTQNGVVQLNGFVESADARVAAESTARTIDGVRSVDNNLEVRPGDRSVGGTIDDAAISAKVKAAMLVDSRTKAYQVDVKTSQGTVVLGGFVATPAEKSAAQELAGSVEGVTQVQNNIVVDRSKSPAAK